MFSVYIILLIFGNCVYSDYFLTKIHIKIETVSFCRVFFIVVDEDEMCEEEASGTTALPVISSCSAWDNDLITEDIDTTGHHDQSSSVEGRGNGRPMHPSPPPNAAPPAPTMAAATASVSEALVPPPPPMATPPRPPLTPAPTVAAAAAAASQGASVTDPNDVLVVARPEMLSCRITPEDEFVLLACDGLFDVFSTDEV